MIGERKDLDGGRFALGIAGQFCRSQPPRHSTRLCRIQFQRQRAFAEGNHLFRFRRLYDGRYGREGVGQRDGIGLGPEGQYAKLRHQIAAGIFARRQWQLQGPARAVRWVEHADQQDVFAGRRFAGHINHLGVGDHTAGPPAIGGNSRIVVGAQAHRMRRIFGFARPAHMQKNAFLFIRGSIARILPPTGDRERAAGRHAGIIQFDLQQSRLETGFSGSDDEHADAR